MLRQSKAEQALHKQINNIKYQEELLHAKARDITAQLAILFATRTEIENEIDRLKNARKRASELRK